MGFNSNLIIIFLQFNQIYDYIIKNRQRDGFLSAEANCILRDLMDNPLGVKCHEFTVSYSFVATVSWILLFEVNLLMLIHLGFVNRHHLCRPFCTVLRWIWNNFKEIEISENADVSREEHF